MSTGVIAGAPAGSLHGEPPDVLRCIATPGRATSGDARDTLRHSRCGVFGVGPAAAGEGGGRRAGGVLELCASAMMDFMSALQDGTLASRSGQKTDVLLWRRRH